MDHERLALQEQELEAITAIYDNVEDLRKNDAWKVILPVLFSVGEHSINVSYIYCLHYV